MSSITTRELSYTRPCGDVDSDQTATRHEACPLRALRFNLPCCVQSRNYLHEDARLASSKFTCIMNLGVARDLAAKETGTERGARRADHSPLAAGKCRGAEN
jgi:hypothetical protein